MNKSKIDGDASRGHGNAAYWILCIFLLLLAAGRYLPLPFVPVSVRQLLQIQLLPAVICGFGITGLLLCSYILRVDVKARFLPLALMVLLIVSGPIITRLEIRALIWINENRSPNEFVNPFAGMVLVTDPGAFGLVGDKAFVFSRGPMTILDGPMFGCLDCEAIIYERGHGIRMDNPELDTRFYKEVYNEDWYRFSSDD